MKLKLVVLLCISIVSFSCANDDDSDPTIFGEWQLIEIQEGFGASSTFFNSNDVTYIFNTDGTLEINSTIPLYESQVTTYEIVEDCFLEGCPSGLASQITDIIIIGTTRNLFLLLDDTNLRFGTLNPFDGIDYIFERP